MVSVFMCFVRLTALYRICEHEVRADKCLECLQKPEMVRFAVGVIVVLNLGVFFGCEIDERNRIDNS